MLSLTREKLQALHQREKQFQVSRMPVENGYHYTVNGKEVDYPTFRIAIDLIRHPEEIDKSGPA